MKICLLHVYGKATFIKVNQLDMILFHRNIRFISPGTHCF